MERYRGNLTVCKKWHTAEVYPKKCLRKFKEKRSKPLQRLVRRFMFPKSMTFLVLDNCTDSESADLSALWHCSLGK